MDYLISEGYPSAAQKFAHEANIAPMLDVDSVEERVSIRRAIYEGDIQTAIEQINELNPQVRLASPQTYPLDKRHCYDYTCSCTTHRSFGILMRNKTLQSSV